MLPSQNIDSSNYAGSKSLGLQRRLLEVAVVVGMDEETGLQCKHSDHNLNVEDKGLFCNHYKPHVLDIISGTQEQSTILSTPTNFAPPGMKAAFRKKLSLRQSSTEKISGTLKKVTRNRSIRKLKITANREEEVPVSTDFLNNLPSVCLPNDSRVLCKPEKPRIHLAVLTDIKGTRHYSVILQLYQSFAAVKNDVNARSLWSLSDPSPTQFSNLSDDGPIECYVPLCICLVTSLPYFDVLKDALSCLSKEWEKFNPYKAFRSKLQKFVTNLSVIPLPPPGIRVSFVLNGWPFMMYPPKDVSRPSVVTDIDLSIPILAFLNKFETLLKILTAILLEQRLVFVSKNTSLTVIAMEALLRFIFPFHWPHPYIPALFSDRIDFVACPGIFMMGCHAVHKNQIKEIENDQVLVDLDSGKACLCPSFEGKTIDEDQMLENGDGDELDMCIPDSTAKTVIQRLSELRLFNTDHLLYPNPVTMEELAREKTAKRQKLNEKIENIFLDMMVDLFSDAVHYIDHEVDRFHSDDFLKASSENDRAFYEKVVKTYMFRKFVKERRKGTADMFSRVAETRGNGDVVRASRRKKSLEQRRRRSASENNFSSSTNRKETHHKSTSSQYFSSFVRSSSRSNEKDCDSFVEAQSTEKSSRQPSETTNGLSRKCNNATMLPEKVSDEEQYLTFSLPPFPEPGTNFNTTLFYRRCLNIINDLMKSPHPKKDRFSSKDSLIRRTFQASCLVLRGIYSIVSGDTIRGLEDLHDTAKEDLRVFPLTTIKTVIRSLSSEELEKVRRQSFYKEDKYYEGGEGIYRHEPLHYDDDLPCVDLDFNTFLAIVQRSALSNDLETITHLFNALSTTQNSDSVSESGSDSEDKTVDHEAFEVFYNTWKQRHEENEDFRANMVAADNKSSYDLLRESESILKVSDVVSSDKGTGRLILTNERIFFMTESNEDCKFEARLTQIKNVKVIKQKIRLRGFNSFQFQKGDEIPFRVALKSECEIWRIIVEEMRTGRIQAKNLRDHLTTSDIAAQNVRVINVLYEAASDGELMDVSCAMEWAKRLCKFTRQFSSGLSKKLPSDTADMLLLKIDLSPMETNKSLVNKILYSPIKACEDALDSSCVWIALSSSKIRMVTTNSWSLDPYSITDFNANLLSLCVVDRELWVGASDKSIHVIQCASLQRTQVLHEHSAPVISVFNCGNKVVSASKSGEIIFWDKEMKKKSSHFTISSARNQLVCASKLNDETICCCSKSTISLHSFDGGCLQSLSIIDFEFSAGGHDITCCMSDNSGNEICAGDANGSVYVWHRKHGGTASSSELLGDRHNRFVPFKRNSLWDENPEAATTCIMRAYDGRVWVGNSLGDISILNENDLVQEMLLKAHDDAVTSLCQVENRCVVSGSKSNDGKIFLWRFENL